MKNNKKPLIGQIGIGWIGKHYADNFEERDYKVVRYAKEPEYENNKDKIGECDIVFIAVPTPTTIKGFDFSIVQEVLKLIGRGKIAVIKSTILPGTTEILQNIYPDITVLHSPEFLTEATAKYDVAYPNRNIIGYVDDKGAVAAELVMKVLPLAPYKSIIPAKEAEMIKYTGNCWFYFKVMYINILYELCQKLDIEYEIVKQGMSYDPRVGFTHLDVEHQGGRGAGGHCFIKDFAAFREIFSKKMGDGSVADELSLKILEALEDKNIQLLTESGKSLDLLKGVYGNGVGDNTNSTLPDNVKVEYEYEGDNKND